MDQAIKWARLALYVFGCIFLLALTLLALQSREAIVATEKGTEVLSVKANDSLDALNATLAKINAPCRGPAGPDACGTLAQVNKSVIDIGDMTVAAQKQVSQTAGLVKQYGATIDSIAADVHREMLAAQDATAAVTGTAQQATTDLATLNTSFQSLQPLVGHLDATTVSANDSLARFNALLADPSIPTTMKNVADITTSGTQIMRTTSAVEDKLAQCTLHPTLACSLKSNLIFGAQVGGYILGSIH